MMALVIAGNIGKDAVTRSTQNGDQVTGFSVAVEDRSGKEKATVWFDVSLWGKRGESLAKYLTKGQKVTVSGGLGLREHEGKTHLTLRANDVTLMGGKPEGDRPERQDRGKQDLARQAPPRDDMDSDLPF